MSGKLYICRGLQGSGKTTWAKKFVAEDLSHHVRVNRDDIRTMLHDSVYDVTANTELKVITARDVLIKTYLSQGMKVVCDDTNLKQSVVKDLVKLTNGHQGVDWDIIDFTSVPLAVCLTQNEYRKGTKGYVDPAVIIETNQKFLKGKTLPLPIPDVNESILEVEPYHNTLELKAAIICDLDGTAFHMNGRSPYDESDVYQDTPDYAVKRILSMYRKEGFHVIFMSGRTEGCRDQTNRAIQDNLGLFSDEYSLFMRSVGDTRKDSVVKLELFNEYVRNNYYIEAVYDDRDQVVKLWRDLGLKCLQVAEGNF